MPLAQENLDPLVQRAGELYTLPRVAVEVLELTRQPTVEAWKLKQCIEKDPALTAKLLRVVNSPLFGLSRTVSDLTQALAILGTKPLKLLVLGFSLPEKLFQQTAGDFLARYWQRTLVKAVAARELAPYLPRVSGDEAFIAALLQDIGVLVLVHELGADYIVLREAAATAGSDPRLWERSALGFDHTQLSSRLLSHWQLPEAVVAAARLPASPEELEAEACRQQPLRQMVYLADLLSQVLLDQRPEALQELLTGIRAVTSLDEPQLARLVDELQQKVGRLAEVLSLELPGQIDYSELLERAFAELKPLAASAACELVQLRRQTSLEQADDWLQSTVGQSLQQRVQPRLPAAAARAARTPTTAAEPVPTERSPAATSTCSPTQSDRALVMSLASAITACRQRRVPISLLLANVDESARSEAVLDRLMSLCSELDHAELRCHRLDACTVAVVLGNCDRRYAVQLGQRLLDTWRRQADRDDPLVPLSLGVAAVALAPRNFPAPELIAAATRCLSGAQSSGGNCLKSVEL